MTDLDVLLSPAALRPDALAGRTVAVVDVFRASPCIVTALSNGARAVVPARDIDDAGRLAATFDGDAVLVGGDRDGDPLDGDSFAGNPFGGSLAGASPSDYTSKAVRGRTVVLTTANGTPVLAAARAAETAVLASFLNASRAAAFLHSVTRTGQPVSIVCAGADGRVALEDVLCAGFLLSRFLQPADVARLGDAAQMAFALYAGSHAQLPEALAGTTGARRLRALGLDDDVSACLQLDSYDALPVLHDGKVVIDEAERLVEAV